MIHVVYYFAIHAVLYGIGEMEGLKVILDNLCILFLENKGLCLFTVMVIIFGGLNFSWNRLIWNIAIFFFEKNFKYIAAEKGGVSWL